MARPNTQTILHSFLYGGASVLLLFDVYFLIRALFETNFVPIVPIVAGICIAGGLLLIVYSEQNAREYDKKEHRRLSRVAHQLENPLKTLQEDLAYMVSHASKLPAEERMKLKRMSTKTTILLENVRDVFLMLQAQGGVVTKEVQTYDACVLVEEVLTRLKPQASARNVELTKKAHCIDAPVKVDRQLFLLALSHLIENAITYTMTPGLVNVVLIRGKKFVRIIVQDRGIGVQPEDKEAIFMPYMRGKEADRYDTDGIGTGLTLSQLIIREFDGKLTWRPRDQKAGSEFEISLPLAV